MLALTLAHLGGCGDGEEVRRAPVVEVLLLAELAVVLGVVRALNLLGLDAQQRLLGLLPPHQHVGLAVLGRVLGQLLGNVLDLCGRKRKEKTKRREVACCLVCGEC